MINGITLRDAIISGANSLTAARQSVDELNVFPVPDGDTGTNMSMTIGAAARELKNSKATAACDIADVTASAMLRGARGNSGVILSLLFRGIAKSLKGTSEISGLALAAALKSGVDSAYKAVMKPTEGTILTVARIGAEDAKAAADGGADAVEVFEAAYNGALKALATTPELLPVLKKAGVVDAGGKGLTIVYEGMLTVLKGGAVIEEGGASKPAQVKADTAANPNAEPTFTYSAEFTVKRDEKVTTDPAALRAYLETIGGSVTVDDDKHTIKVQVCTDNPGKALQRALVYGMLTDIKIDNMREQYEREADDAARAEGVSEITETAPAPKDNKYGFVSVCAGEGLRSLFADLGADNIVSGGQTMNPSTEDILRAVEATPAEIVFVLPNNKNIIMAAEQAIPLADRKVNVLPTRTIPMGMSAMLAFDPDADEEDNLIAMTHAADKVSTGQITFAARDSDFEGKNIHEGDILAISDGKLAFTDNDIIKAAVRLTRSMLRKDSAFVTVIFGEDVSQEQADLLQSELGAKLPASIETNVISGGQPVYYFIISVE